VWSHFESLSDITISRSYDLARDFFVRYASVFKKGDFMILSERGAIRAAIADGGFHLYPAGRFIDYIKQALQGDDLKGNFDPVRTKEKISAIPAPQDEHAGAVFEQDRSLLLDRLQELRPEYNIELVFGKMAECLPAMAKRYYGIEAFTPVTPKIVEYYFEGHNDFYRDSDWIAFNVNEAESHELNVPVGTYFKRDQVSPGHPEFTVMHEANHAMQEIAALPPGVHHYVPWLDEGLADAFGRMMLFAATEDETLLRRIKIFRTEIEVTDPRKVTYHYGEETAALLLLRGRLPFVKAVCRARKESPYDIDWNGFAAAIKHGIDPHIAIVTAYGGSKKDHFQKRIAKNEAEFRKESDLSQSDLRVLTMFLATQPPAVIPASEYRAALWLAEEVQKDPSPHFVDCAAIPEGLRSQVPEWKSDALLRASAIPEGLWKKVAGIRMKIVIKASDVPENFRAGADALANSYFVIKRRIGETDVYEPYGGGLPYRLGSFELRCAWQQI